MNQASNPPWLFTFCVTLGRKLRRRNSDEAAQCFILDGDNRCGVEKGAAASGRGPDIPVKFDHFSSPLALDISFSVSALQRPWTWLEQEEQEHLLRATVSIRRGVPEYTGAEFREVFPRACHQRFRTSQRVLAP
jgi:hypothetical protein